MRLVAILFLLSVQMVTLTLANDLDNHDNKHTIGNIELEMDVEDSTISIKWQVNSTDMVYGYKIVLKDSDAVYIYESPVLNKHATEMDLTQDLHAGDVSVCLLVLHNTTYMAGEKCQTVSVSSMKMVVGIIAGVVFLIPCMAALIFIIYKDRQLLHAKSSYDPGETKSLIKPPRDHDIAHTVTMVDEEMQPHSSKAKSIGMVNKSFDADLESIDLGSDTKSDKSELNAETNTKNTKLTDSTVDKGIASQTQGTERPRKDTDKAKTEVNSGRKNSKKEAVFVIRL